MSTQITLVAGDGIGPEITQAVVEMLEAAAPGALSWERLDLGEAARQAGHPDGIEPGLWDSLQRTGVLLKGPTTTPQGGGHRSLNVSLRQRLGLAVNLRPVRSLAPWVPSLHPQLDLLVVRENEEDLYAGLEYQYTAEVVGAFKLISRSGCERVIRYAMEYAQAHGRERVTALVKDNILKLTDGMFAQVFREVGEEYPQLQRELQLVDIGMARLATVPEQFQVVVCENLYGDIVSDVVAQLAGSVGLAGSANLGEDAAMFEAIHGSAPDLAGQNKANPSGLLQGALLMLQHLDLAETASAVEAAWLCTLEDGIHTVDLQGEHTREVVGTAEFAAAVIQRLGRHPRQLRPAPTGSRVPVRPARPHAGRQRELLGVDLFLHEHRPVPQLAAQLLPLLPEGLQLQAISCRGVQVWPEPLGPPPLVDHLRCRVLARGGAADPVQLAELQLRLAQQGLEVVRSDGLYALDGQPVFGV